MRTKFLLLMLIMFSLGTAVILGKNVQKLLTAQNNDVNNEIKQEVDFVILQSVLISDSRIEDEIQNGFICDSLLDFVNISEKYSLDFSLSEYNNHYFDQYSIVLLSFFHTSDEKDITILSINKTTEFNIVEFGIQSAVNHDSDILTTLFVIEVDKLSNLNNAFIYRINNTLLPNYPRSAYYYPGSTYYGNKEE
ncbi:hypothetical protein [Paracholeplasma manati]|uniref:hypothetical protein n=1 Tax=Paracholeplasma manati TaxID=591373 RepID=UPI0024088D37|nr:hypothetical protein [Paracholeplasma manati]MDG0889593.1 hypothetical protein [Paracholeplasma manati]